MKKFFIALIGGTVLLLGLALLLLPGPGTLVIAAAVAILATEFAWARRAWRKVKGTVARARRKSGLRLAAPRQSALDRGPSTSGTWRRTSRKIDFASANPNQS